MTDNIAFGWVWSPGVRGLCRVCRRFGVGVWRFFPRDSVTSTIAVCEHCAGGVVKGEE